MLTPNRKYCHCTTIEDRNFIANKITYSHSKIFQLRFMGFNSKNEDKQNTVVCR